MKLFIATYYDVTTWSVYNIEYETIGIFSSKLKCYQAFANYLGVTLKLFCSSYVDIKTSDTIHPLYIEEIELDKDYFTPLNI